MKHFPALCFTIGHDFKFVCHSDITYVESYGNYVHIHFVKDSKITLSKNLKELKKSLAEEFFVQIHHSIIVNLIYVKKYHLETENNTELTDGTLLPLSRRKKSNFINRFVKL